MARNGEGPPAKGGRTSGRGGLGAWIKTHKPEAAALGAVGLVGVVWIVQHGSGSTPGASTSTSGDASGATSQTGITSGYAYDPGLYGYGAGSGYGDTGFTSDTGLLQALLSNYTLVKNGAASPGGATTGSTSGSKPPTAPPPSHGKVSPPPKPRKKTTAAHWITVPKGASLRSLSQKYLGTSNRTALAHANHLGTGAGLRTGQRLLIPAH